MRALIVLAITLASTAVTAQPTTTKPDEAAPVTTTGVATIKVTTKRFAAIKPGKKLTLSVLKKAFGGKATIAKAKAGGWTIANKATGLVATADATQIIVTAGPVEAHGITIGSDGSAIAGANLTGAFCVDEKSGEARVTCSKDALTLRLGECRAQPQGDSIPLDALSGCKVEAIIWIAYAPPK
jgi:hypothetical protein